MAANNPYTSTTISGFNSGAPSNDGAREAQNQLDWDKHIDKIGTPLKNGVESVDTNVSAAFGALIMTDDPAQEGVITAMAQFLPRPPDLRQESKRIEAKIQTPESENFVVGTAMFSG